MVWNPENLQRYEDEMRERRRQQDAAAEREAIEWEREQLRRENAELHAKLQAQCSHNWLGGYCDLCGAIKKV